MHTDQKQKAEVFRALHHGPKILVLPNAWDAASAVILGAVRIPGNRHH
jgi:2-methylisocitrate lyase-like PEP mutase family enzyme